jgi:hypothetical protein
MSIAEKIPYMLKWYHEANEQLQKSGLRKDMLADMVKASNLVMIS